VSYSQGYEQTSVCKMKKADAVDAFFPETNAKVEAAVGENNDYLWFTDAVYENWDTFAGSQGVDESPAPAAYLDLMVLVACCML